MVVGGGRGVTGGVMLWKRVRSREVSTASVESRSGECAVVLSII